MAADATYSYTPVNQGKYDKARGIFDGVTGFFDGLAGVTNSVGSIVSAGTDIQDDLTASDLMADRAYYEKLEAEQDLQLELLKTERGDNVKIYFVVGAVALLGVLLVAR